jgi:hypothetical protein
MPWGRGRRSGEACGVSAPRNPMISVIWSWSTPESLLGAAPPPPPTCTVCLITVHGVFTVILVFALTA